MPTEMTGRTAGMEIQKRRPGEAKGGQGRPGEDRGGQGRPGE